VKTLRDDEKVFMLMFPPEERGRTDAFIAESASRFRGIVENGQKSGLPMEVTNSTRHNNGFALEAKFTGMSSDSALETIRGFAEKFESEAGVEVEGRYVSITSNKVYHVHKDFVPDRNGVIGSSTEVEIQDLESAEPFYTQATAAKRSSGSKSKSKVFRMVVIDMTDLHRDSEAEAETASAAVGASNNPAKRGAAVADAVAKATPSVVAAAAMLREISADAVVELLSDYAEKRPRGAPDMSHLEVLFSAVRMASRILDSAIEDAGVNKGDD
jgi:hypothetical protein